MNPNIKILEDKIKSARAAYYNNGTSPIEDAMYDAWEDALRELDPTNPILNKVGSAENILNKVTHTIPMGSLNKAMNRKEFEDWFYKVRRQGKLLHCSYKMDGGSIALKYKHGNLVQAISRGDGIEGEDITHNALHFHSVPTKDVRFDADGESFTGEIRAELILDNKNWAIVDPELASNPRNLAVGLSKRIDSTEAKHLTVYAFGIFDEDGVKVFSSDCDAILHLHCAGFNTPPHVMATDPDGVWKFVTDTEKIRSTLPYWIDGIVASVDDKFYQDTFEKEDKPKWAIAIKFAARTTSTVLREVTYQVGHTGKVVPVGHFDPVIIDGTIVAKALLCNSDVIEALDIAIGDTISVYKAGDIIPRILEVLSRPALRQPIVYPTHCPVCGGKLERRVNVSGSMSADWFCTNDECEAKTLGKIMRFITSVDIKELGKVLVADLIDQNMIHSAADLYSLKEADLANMTLSSGRNLGASTAKKIIDNINNKRELTIPQLIGSIGIRHLGKGRVENIMEACPEMFDDIEDWFVGKLSNNGIANYAGVPNMGFEIQKSLDENKSMVLDMQVNGVTIKKKAAVSKNAKTFCMTGTLSKGRKEIIAAIEGAGHIFQSDVKAGLDYLVMEDPTSDSTKAVKARKLGVKTISEQEMYERF